MAKVRWAREVLGSFGRCRGLVYSRTLPVAVPPIPLLPHPTFEHASASLSAASSFSSISLGVERIATGRATTTRVDGREAAGRTPVVERIDSIIVCCKWKYVGNPGNRGKAGKFTPPPPPHAPPMSQPHAAVLVIVVQLLRRKFPWPTGRPGVPACRVQTCATTQEALLRCRCSAPRRIVDLIIPMPDVKACRQCTRH